MTGARLTITIDCDNDAFANGAGPEVSRILTNHGGWIAATNGPRNDSGPLHDIHGNKVGEWIWCARRACRAKP